MTHRANLNRVNAAVARRAADVSPSPGPSKPKPAASTARFDRDSFEPTPASTGARLKTLGLVQPRGADIATTGVGLPQSLPVPNLTHRDGKLLNPVVTPIYYGDYWATDAGKADRTANDAFAADFGKSSMMGVLKQYGIERASSSASAVAASNGPVAQLVPADVQKLVQAQLDAGTVQKNADGLYTVLLPPGTTLVSTSGNNSREGLGGYHGSFTATDGSTVYYAAIVYSDATGNGINFDGSSRDAASVIESHEWSEAATDPDVANEKLTWYDDQLGEIGDLGIEELPFDQTFTKVDGFAQQLEWSIEDNQFEAISGTDVRDQLATAAFGPAGANLGNTAPYASMQAVDCLRASMDAAQKNDATGALQASLAALQKSPSPEVRAFAWNLAAWGASQLPATQELAPHAIALSDHAAAGVNDAADLAERFGPIMFGSGWKTGPSSAPYAQLDAAGCYQLMQRASTPDDKVGAALFGLSRNPDSWTRRQLLNGLAQAAPKASNPLMESTGDVATQLAALEPVPSAPAEVWKAAGETLAGSGWNDGSALSPFDAISPADCLKAAQAAATPEAAVLADLAGLSKQTDKATLKALWLDFAAHAPFAQTAPDLSLLTGAAQTIAGGIS